MARDTDGDAGAQRTDYSGKASESGRGKLISSKPEEMIKAGGANSDGSGGPTGSSRSYPKGKSGSFSADFNPMDDKKRSGTDWAVGGV